MFIAELDTGVKGRHRGPTGSSSIDEHLAPNDRRILLGATLRLFLRRLQHGLPVTQDALRRAAMYGDVDGSAAAARRRVARQSAADL